LVSDNNGWAVGTGSVCKLTNGVWTDVSSTYGQSFTSDNYTIDLTDMDNGWAGGSEGSIVQLSGGNWNLYVDPDPGQPSDNITCIKLVNEGSFWMATMASGTYSIHFFKYENLSWKDSGEITTGNQFNSGVNSIVLDDINNVFAYGSHIWKLSNETWSVLSDLGPQNLSDSITFLGIKENSGTYSGWAYYDPDIYTLNNEVFKKLTDNVLDDDVPMPSGTRPVKIINEENGDIWAVCSNGAIWNYDDSTSSWSVTTVGGGNKFYQAYKIGSDFIDINKGRVVGYASLLDIGEGINLKLENGTWDFAPSISKDEYFTSIALTDINNGWAGGIGGNKAFARLDNGTWTLNDDITIYPNDKVTAIDLIDIDIDNGWAAGTVSDKDTFWKLEDGTWSIYEQAFTTNHRPNFIHLDNMTNGGNGWATARNGAKWVLSGGIWTLERDGRPEADGIPDDKVMFYPIDANNGWETITINGIINIWKLVNNVWDITPTQLSLVGPITAWAFQDMDNGWIAVYSTIYKVENGEPSYYYADENGYATDDTRMDDAIYYIWLQDHQNGWAIGRNMSIYRLSPNE